VTTQAGWPLSSFCILDITPKVWFPLLYAEEMLQLDNFDEKKWQLPQKW
jgi:hypothetical protein